MGKFSKYTPADIKRSVESCDKQIRSLNSRIAFGEEDKTDLKRRLKGYEAVKKQLEEV